MSGMSYDEWMQFLECRPSQYWCEYWRTRTQNEQKKIIIWLFVRTRMDSWISIIVCCTLQGSNPSLRAVHLGWELADLSKNSWKHRTTWHCRIATLLPAGRKRTASQVWRNLHFLATVQSPSEFPTVCWYWSSGTTCCASISMIHHDTSAKSWKNNSLLVLQQHMILTWPLTTGISSDSVTSRSRNTLC